MSTFLLKIAALFKAPLENAAEAELETVLQDLHTSNAAEYEIAVVGGHALCTLLLPKAAGNATLTEVITVLDATLVASAKANGVTLSVPGVVAATADAPSGDTPPVNPINP